MEYSAEAFCADDLDEIVGLHRHLLPRGREANRRYLTWKYLENPFIEDPLITVVRHGREIIAMEGLVGMSWRLSLEDSAYVMPQADDLVVHPDHRRRGVSSLLSREVRETARRSGYRGIVNMSGGDVSQAMSAARGWVDVRELNRMYVVRRSGSAPAMPRWSIAGRATSMVERIVRRFGHGTEAPPSNRDVDAAVEFVPGQSRDITVSREADVEAMAVLASGYGRHASDRSEGFLRWRVGNPDRAYRFLYWRDTQLRGYMIVGWSGEHPERVMIVDHCFEHESVFADLLGAAMRIPRVDIEMMASTLPRPSFEAACGLGFRLDSECRFSKRRFFIWPLGSDSEDRNLRAAASSWRVDIIDTLQG